MPPRKSTASSAAPTSPTAATNADVSMLSTTSAAEPKSPTTKKSGSKQQDDSSVGIEDLLLPRSLTSRLARGILPPNTSLQKDAVLALTKSATVFISYLASHANEQRPSAKTVTPQDVLNALKEIELDKVMDVGKIDEETGKVAGRLEREMAVYEEVVKGKRKGYRDKVKARESGLGGAGEGVDGEREDGERVAKRVRMDEDGDETVDVDESRAEEDAMLEAQLNGGVGNDDTEVEEQEEEDPEDEEEEDPEDEAEDEEQDEEQDETEDIDRIDVEDESMAGRRVSSRSTKGRHSMLLSPNGRAEVGGSDDDSD